MFNSCGTPAFAGLSDCKLPLQEVIGGIVSIKNSAKYTAAELETITKTKGYISTENGIVSIYIPFNKFTVTTEALKFETATSGKRRNYEKPIPSATGFVDATLWDYVTMYGWDSSEIDLELVTINGLRIMTPTADVKYKGFRGVLNVEIGLPDVSKKLEMYPMYFSFSDIQEFVNMVAFQLPYTATDIADCVPVGMEITKLTEMVSGEIDVKVRKRASGTGVTSITVWNVIDSNVTTPAVTATDDGAGSYTLACTKDTSTDLATGDYIYVQCLKKATTTVTYLSNVIRIDGKS